ncbi:hypothetical protein QYM36_015583, partial [Artemia franciscana]
MVQNVIRRGKLTPLPHSNFLVPKPMLILELKRFDIAGAGLAETHIVEESSK